MKKKISINVLICLSLYILNVYKIDAQASSTEWPITDGTSNIYYSAGNVKVTNLLEVGGILQINNILESSNSIKIKTTAENKDITFKVNNTEVLRLSKDHRIIATRSGYSLGTWGSFDVSGATVRVINDASNLYIDGSTMLSDGNFKIGTTTEQDLVFGTNSKEAFKVTKQQKAVFTRGNNIGNWGNGMNVENATMKIGDNGSDMFIDGNTILSRKTLKIGTNKPNADLSFGLNKKEMMKLKKHGTKSRLELNGDIVTQYGYLVNDRKVACWFYSPNSHGNGIINDIYLDGYYVGIGTDSPDNNFEIYDDFKGGVGIRLTSTLENAPYLNAWDIDVYDGDLFFKYGHSPYNNFPSDDIGIYTGELFRFTNAGIMVAKGLALDNDVFARAFFSNAGGASYYLEPANTGTSLRVAGKIESEEIQVKDMSSNTIKTNNIKTDYLNVSVKNVADYVFEDYYELKSLTEVEQFVKENKHLPGIPKGKEIEENGMNVAEMNNLLLQKIEELTLYMIELKKENDILKEKVSKLETKE